MTDTQLRTVGQLREALRHSDDDETLDIILGTNERQIRCLAASVGSTAGGRATILFLDYAAPTQSFFHSNRFLMNLPVGQAFRINGALFTLIRREAYTIWYKKVGVLGAEEQVGDVDELCQWKSVTASGLDPTDLQPVPAIDHGDPTVACLNRAFQADPAAIYALIQNRVPCNDDLTNDPLVAVDAVRVLDGNIAMVGAMGLISGILTANNLPLVAWMFETSTDDDDKKSRKLMGFCNYLPPVSQVPVIVRWHVPAFVDVDVDDSPNQAATHSWSEFYHHPRIQRMVKDAPDIKFYVSRKYPDKPLMASSSLGAYVIGYLDEHDFPELGTWDESKREGLPAPAIALDQRSNTPVKGAFLLWTVPEKDRHGGDVLGVACGDWLGFMQHPRMVELVKAYPTAKFFVNRTDFQLMMTHATGSYILGRITSGDFPELSAWSPAMLPGNSAPYVGFPAMPTTES